MTAGTITESEKTLLQALEGKALWNKGIGWLLWDGKVWQESPESHAVEIVREQALAQLQSVLDQQRAEPDKDLSGQVDDWRSALSAARLTRIIKLASARDGVLFEASTLDAHPHLLNVQNGVVDLRTGELRPHSRGRLMTRIAAVDYVPDAYSGVWAQVLGDLPETTRDHLKSSIGQAVSGHQAEKITALHGWGPSGKTTLLQAIREALGTYAVAQHLQAVQRSSQFALMDLRGTRLVTADDLPGANLGRLKRLVSPEPITTRKMRRDSITFQPSHSLVVVVDQIPEGLDDDTRHNTVPVEFPALNETNPEVRRRVREPEALRAVMRWVVDCAVSEYASA